MNRSGLVALVVAVLALIVAAYAVASMNKLHITVKQVVPNVTVKLIDSVVVDVPGVRQVWLGWVYTDAPVVAEFRAYGTPNGTLWFLIDNTYYGNPAVATLDAGNHTVAAVVAVNGTAKIKITYRIVG